MSTIADTYRRRADAFERKVAAVQDWTAQSPCKGWTARDVFDHVIFMHGVMLRPRGLSPAPADPLGIFRSARSDLLAVLDDPAQATAQTETPTGPMTAEQHIDAVTSRDMVLHGWDLARATGQDDTIDPADLRELWDAYQAIPAEVMVRYRTPGAFGPGIEVFGPEVIVPADAPLQDRLLGMIGRDPRP